MSGLSETHAEWLEDRQLSVEVAARMGVHSRGPAVAFPYVLAGNPLYVKTRDPRDKKATRCVPSGVEQTTLWNEDCLQDDPSPTDMLIITEGEPDAVAVKQSGYQFVVSLPSGAASTLEGCQSKALKCLTVDEGGKPVLKRDIEKFKRVLVMTDGDHDGLLMRKAIIEVIGEAFCCVPEYPEGCKDANDVLVSAKAALLADDQALRSSLELNVIIDNARPVKSDGFLDFIEAEKVISPLKPMSCGIAFLEKHFKPVRPSLIVIGGQASHGKSTLTQAILFNLLDTNDNLRASIFHGEGDKTIPVQRAKKFWRGKNARSATQFDERSKDARDGWIKERLAYIRPSQDELPTFDWLLWAMEQQALYRRRNVFVIDPWNQIVLRVPSRMNKTDYIGECIYQMKRLADRLGLIIIIAHHTPKPSDTRSPPTRYDLADSAHWVNAADHLLLGWKPFEDQNFTRLEIAKSKDHDKMGKPGHVWVTLVADVFELALSADPRKPVQASDVEQREMKANAAADGPAPYGQIADEFSLN